MSNNKGNKVEKKQEEFFHKVHVNCEKPININIDSKY